MTARCRDRAVLWPGAIRCRPHGHRRRPRRRPVLRPAAAVGPQSRSGQPARAGRARPTGAARNTVVAVLFVFVTLGLGIALPLADPPRQPRQRQRAGRRGQADRRGQERPELFGEHCAVCHTLAAANAIGKVGPNLDMLKPPKAQVLHTIANGCLPNATVSDAERGLPRPGRDAGRSRDRPGRAGRGELRRPSRRALKRAARYARSPPGIRAPCRQLSRLRPGTTCTVASAWHADPVRQSDPRSHSSGSGATTSLGRRIVTIRRAGAERTFQPHALPTQSAPSAPAGSCGVPGRRTSHHRVRRAVVRSRAVTVADQRRPYVPRHQRDGFVPIGAGLAVALAFLLVLVAAASAPRGRRCTRVRRAALNAPLGRRLRTPGIFIGCADLPLRPMRRTC